MKDKDTKKLEMLMENIGTLGNLQSELASLKTRIDDHMNRDSSMDPDDDHLDVDYLDFGAETNTNSKKEFVRYPMSQNHGGTITFRGHPMPPTPENIAELTKIKNLQINQVKDYEGELSYGEENGPGEVEIELKGIDLPIEFGDQKTALLVKEYFDMISKILRQNGWKITTPEFAPMSWDSNSGDSDVGISLKSKSAHIAKLRQMGYMESVEPGKSKKSPTKTKLSPTPKNMAEFKKTLKKMRDEGKVIYKNGKYSLPTND